MNQLKLWKIFAVTSCFVFLTLYLRRSGPVVDGSTLTHSSEVQIVNDDKNQGGSDPALLSRKTDAITFNPGVQAKVEKTSPTHATDISDLVVPALRDKKVDPAKVRLVLESSASPIAKRILLSELALLENRKNIPTVAFWRQTHELQLELRSRKGEVIGAVEDLARKESEFPDGFAANLLSLTALSGNYTAPEVQNMALNQIRTLVAGDLSTNEAKIPLVNAIASYINSQPDSAIALQTVAGMLDMKNANQSKAYRMAQAMVNSQQGHPRSPAQQ